MSGYTHYHSKYLAHRITLEGFGEDAFTKSLSTARVDMNPHQVDAALFALASPLSRGAILADEVGLGKTIEASLVIAQRWAERRRRVLLIAPASLRKQWSQELRDKFSLPSLIMEARTYRDAEKAGNRRPFDVSGQVVITSYEFAARKAAEVKATPWDLVVFDEAHRLRNVYKKDGSRRAKDLKDALAGPFKILLTATPLQNSLMELYGLVSMIDDRFFGDEKTFRTMYVTGRPDALVLATLKGRLAAICRRTLRRDVQEAGHINYTKRFARTFDFEPADREAYLYEKVSTYLQRKDSIAFGAKPNALITMVARKTLGSSTYAIQQFLEKVIARLEAKLPIDESIAEDFDVADETLEELDTGADPNDNLQDVPIDPAVLAAEIAELKSYRDLAAEIGSNAKGEKLVAKLPEVLEEIEKRGGKRKAVIFTESVRTQRYLADLLGANGYGGRIVLLNGSNNDADSKQVYADWLARYKGTEAISGSKSADMKAAVVDAFKSEDKTILIATESGAEGINLQFCSLVVNFDLPWNPQRVEQRIGRCHRYGQKIDVAVVNLLNRRNHAEARVYQLLDEKFQLFEGVFGASDEVLGAIERGIDFERTVLEIVQGSRTNAEIDQAFTQLQLDLQEQIDADMLDARKKLLETMDANVVARLRDRKGALEGVLGDYAQRLVTIAKSELPAARFHSPTGPRFDYDGQTWTTEWPLADEKGWRFFRMGDGSLAETVVEAAKARSLAPGTMQFDYAAYRNAGFARLLDVEPLIGKSGYLSVSRLRIESPAAVRESLVVAAQTDDGDPIASETADRLFLIPAMVDNSDAALPNDTLRALEELEKAAHLAAAERENSKWLDEKTEQLESYADDVERAAEARIKELGIEIKAARKALRANQGISLADKLTEQKRIGALEQEQDELKMATYQRRKEIQREVQATLDDMAASLAVAPKLEPLFAIRWGLPA
jgi:superfamily II DNA or RNA helicase